MNSTAAPPRSRFLADCHLHFEGCLPLETVERLSARAGHPFRDRLVFERERRTISSASRFLNLFAEICRLFRAPDDYRDAARDVSLSLSSSGVAHGELYVSPEIFRKLGLDAAACLEAVDQGLAAGSEAGGARCAILLDTVRHWGAEAGDRVLDLYEKNPLPSIVGFGMGGDERSFPAAAFAGVYARARALGLKTSVHAGEWCGADSVREALDALRPDRVDHGIAAAQDAELLRRLAGEEITLCVAPSGNVVTGAVGDFARHPLKRLVEAGVRVALSADDPLFFATTTLAEYARVRRALGLEDEELRRLAQNGWRGSFAAASVRSEGLAALEGWVVPDSGKEKSEPV
ncbi:MAG TPA: adenosine deaminase [Thermoanaerobaculia bacterium]